MNTDQQPRVLKDPVYAISGPGADGKFLIAAAFAPDGTEMGIGSAITEDGDHVVWAKVGDQHFSFTVQEAKVLVTAGELALVVHPVDAEEEDISRVLSGLRTAIAKIESGEAIGEA